MGTVNGFMAARGPAGALAEERGVITAADDDNSRGCLGLEVTLQTEVGVALHQHLIVRRAVRIVAGGADFADGFVFENERAALRGVAFHAGVALAGDGGAAAFDGLAFVRVVAIAAGD